MRKADGSPEGAGGEIIRKKSSLRRQTELGTPLLLPEKKGLRVPDFCPTKFRFLHITHMGNTFCKSLIYWV